MPTLLLRFGRWLISSLGALLLIPKLSSIERPNFVEGETGATGEERERIKQREHNTMLGNEVSAAAAAATAAAGSRWQQQERERRRQQQQHQTPTAEFRGQSERGPRQTSADSSGPSCARPSFGALPLEFATQLQQQQHHHNYHYPCWGQEQRGQQQQQQQRQQQQHDIQAEGFKYPAAMTTCATTQSASSNASAANACQGEEDYYYNNTGQQQQREQQQQQQQRQHSHHHRQQQQQQQQHHRNGGAADGPPSASVLHCNANLKQETRPIAGGDERQEAKLKVVSQASDGHSSSSSSSAPTAAEATSAASLVLVSKATLSQLTDQIAFSMNKMKDLEAQVRVIPELQRQIEHVMNDGSNSVKDFSLSHQILNVAERSLSRSPMGGTSDRTTRGNMQAGRRFSQEQDKGNSLLREYNKSPIHQHYSSNNNNNQNHHNSNNNNNSRHLDNFNQFYRGKQYNNHGHQHASGSGDEDFNQPRAGVYQTSASLSSTPIHRRYNSFRCSPPSSAASNSAKQTSTGCAPLDAICDQRHQQHQHQQTSAASTSSRAGSMCTRSPTFTYSTGGGGAKDYQRRQHALDVHHSSAGAALLDQSRRCSNDASMSASRQSFDLPSMLRRSHNQEASIATGCINSSTFAAATSTPKVEYDDLINDLISLSYSVNYISPTHQSNSALTSQQSPITDQHSTATSISTKHQRQQQPQQQSHDTMHQLSNNRINHYRHHNQNQNLNGNHHQKTSSLSYLSRGHYNGSGGSLSLQPTPVRTPLDCGCLSFKEHLKYNTISREQRLSQATKSQSLLATNSMTVVAAAKNSASRSNTVSPQPTPMRSYSSSNSKCDASTNTDLVMGDIFTRNELENVVTNIQRNFSSNLLSSREGETSHDSKSANSSSFNNQTDSSSSSSSSISSEGTTDSMSGSSSSVGSRSLDSEIDEEQEQEQQQHRKQEQQQPNADDTTAECSSSNKAGTSSEDQTDSRVVRTKKDAKACKSRDKNDKIMAIQSQINRNQQKEEEDNGDDDDDDEEEEEDEVEEEETNGGGSLNCEEPYSLGSSYQDPSDFEEYCAYGESLDRRTKDFMSQSTKIPNDLRFALIRLSDFLKRKDRSQNQIESSSGCIEVIRKEWFAVAANKDSQPSKAKLYVEYFESFTKQLLNVVVNLVDTAGNTAMHYAASHYKLDIIKVLLGTKVCDVNCRNKAGYTPIMLLALAEIEPQDQETARQLFSMGDVNIKARSSGQTALMLASSHGRTTTCKLLLECGADPSLQDYDGSTALMCGSEIGNEEVVRCLLSHPLTDPSATDNDGLDALTIALNNKHKNVGLLLYAATNVPRMARGPSQATAATSTTSQALGSHLISNSLGGGYLGASLRRSRGKMASNFVRRADSLLGPRTNRPMRRSGAF